MQVVAVYVKDVGNFYQSLSVIDFITVSSGGYLIENFR
jgi:hypothetical protein